MQETIGVRDLRLDQQIRAMSEILLSSETLRYVITSAHELGLPDYYIGAGCVAQTVWNHIFGHDLTHGIKDVDIVYYDAERLGYDEENAVVERARALWGHLGLQIDAKNQARVHLWYEQHYGYSIRPYCSLEAAINTWPTTASAIGVRAEVGGELSIYAPFGLNDLLSGIVRPNKAQITKQVYDSKIERWHKTWPGLHVISWDG